MRSALGGSSIKEERQKFKQQLLELFSLKPLTARRFKRVNAGKGIRRKGTDDIKRYFKLTGEPADTKGKPRPTEQTKLLVPSQSKHQEEDPAE